MRTSQEREGGPRAGWLQAKRSATGELNAQETRASGSDTVAGKWCWGRAAATFPWAHAGQLSWPWWLPWWWCCGSSQGDEPQSLS